MSQKIINPIEYIKRTYNAREKQINILGFILGFEAGLLIVLFVIYLNVR